MNWILWILITVAINIHIKQDERSRYASGMCPSFTRRPLYPLFIRNIVAIVLSAHNTEALIIFWIKWSGPIVFSPPFQFYCVYGSGFSSFLESFCGCCGWSSPDGFKKIDFFRISLLHLSIPYSDLLFFFCFVSVSIAHCRRAFFFEFLLSEIWLR